jgi:hypothetical protein
MDVIKALAQRGLWPEHNNHAPRCVIPQTSMTDVGAKHSERAMQVWNKSLPAPGTLAETYLRSRGITIPPPATIRFNANLLHRPSGKYFPAMIALVQQESKPNAIHRTYLAADGRGKAPITPAKMMLGMCSGGAVRSSPAAEKLLIGEGIETTLSVVQKMHIPGWAALSATGMANLILPPIVREIILLADLDPPGEKAARLAASRFERENRSVRIARPKDGFNDFNDMLVAAHDVGVVS